MSAVVWQATPTMWECLQSDSFVRVICGPIGSGKSVMCCNELVRRALQQKPDKNGVRKFRAAMVRNTHQQLQSTTLKTWNDWLGDWGYWKASEKTFYMDHKLPDGTQLKAEFMALSLDEPADVRRALSLELSAAWLNEWRELAPEVVDGILMRLRRYPSMRDGGPSWSGAICDTNGPDQDSYHYSKMIDPPDNWEIFNQPPAILNAEEWTAKFGEAPDDDDKLIGYDNTEWWVNPEADNLNNLDERYYPDILPGKTKDFTDVYLRGKFGRSLAGLPVYGETFNPEIHIAEKEYEPLKSTEYPVVIGLDLGRTPAATLMQRNTRGQVIVFDELSSENMGIETFLDKKLKPLLAQERYLGCTFLVAPDPAGWAKQQIGEISPVDAIKKAGFKVVRPTTNDPEKRVMAVERILSLNIGGHPAFQINKRCKERIAGFRYGYRYKLNKQGIQDQKPDKNEFSHGADSIQYGVLVVEGNQLSGSYFERGQRREVKHVSSRGWT